MAEFRAGGATGTNLSTTEITGATAVRTGSGTIAPTIVGRGGRVPPKEVIDNDTVDPGGEDPTAVSGDVEENPTPTTPHARRSCPSRACATASPHPCGRWSTTASASERQRRGSATEPDPVRGQARVLNGFVRRILDIDSRARVVVLGDLNDFDFSDTLRVLEEGTNPRDRELVNLWHLLPRDQRHSYIFQGNGQVLDHILVSPALLFGGHPDFEPVHLNAEFSDQTSDHDPPIVRFELDGH